MALTILSLFAVLLALIIHVLSDANIRLELWDATQTTLEASTNITTNLPATTDVMRPHLGIESRSGGGTIALDMFLMKMVQIVK